MIRYTTGDLLRADVEALVNAVNTVGVMGKGIALMFRKRFPESYRAYVAACEAGEVQAGRMFVTATGEPDNPCWVIGFPTKRHWRGRSRLDWVREGLTALRDVIGEKRIRSITIPALGCGNGGLDWEDVRPLIEDALGELDDVDVVVYAPMPGAHRRAQG